MGKINRKTTQKIMNIPDKNPIPGNKKFGIDQPLPTSEQKKEGWNRRRQAQEMMDKIKEYMKLPHSEFQKLLDDIKNHPDKYTVQDVLLAKYATKAFNGDKFMLDWFDRNISKAPQEVWNAGADGGELIGSIFLNGRKEANITGNSRSDKEVEK